MLLRLLNKLGIYTSSGWREGYDAGYHQGLDEGGDFGKRVAHNQTLRHELPGILERFSEFILKRVAYSKKTPAQMKELYGEFLQRELQKLEMELQDR